MSAKKPREGSRLFIALSHMVRRDMQQYHRLPDEVIRVVYNGVDTEKFSPACRGLHRDRLRAELNAGDDVGFLIVAHNFKLKGVWSAMDAVARVARTHPRLRLVVVGNDNPKPYQRRAARLGCARKVHFVGPADSVPYYAAADVYVHPTHYDPCSLVVLEALACGLPVITTHHNGAGELLTPGVEGFLLDDPDDVPQLACTMGAFMEPAYRAECSARARKLAEAHGLDRNCREILAVYGEVAGRSRPPALSA